MELQQRHQNIQDHEDFTAEVKRLKAEQAEEERYQQEQRALRRSAARQMSAQRKRQARW